MQEIKNKKIEVESSKELNDENILNDILFNEKCISNNYSVALDEMSNKLLFKKVMDLLIESKEMTRVLFNLAFEKGWYTLQTANETDIAKAHDDGNKKKEELG